MATEPTSKVKGRGRRSRPGPGSRRHIGWIVAGSLATGLIAALLLVAAPFVPAQESAVTGAVLCGFALGWAMLAVLSVRFSDQPQRWAAAPALVMGVGGLLLVSFGAPVDRVLSWVWPPVMLGLAVWMLVGVRRQLHSRGGRWLLYPVIAVLALASIGGGYQTLGAAADAKAYPMPGQLIDVGGHRLHLSCTGSGTPTVVLEPAAGEMSSNLGWIAPAVARATRVCVYDRAGRGWSEPAATPQDGTQIATDLHRLLQRGQVPGPYVLAGHSFGGLYVLTFAARYPDQVAGLVLVDSTAPAAAANAGAASSGQGGSNDAMGRVAALVSTAARVGLGRLYAQFAWGSLPPRSREEVRASDATPSTLRSTIDEYVQANASTEQAAALGDFADKPLVVLTAGSGHDAAWSAAQNRLARLSTNSVHRVIADATHQDLVGNEEDAAATTQAILDVVSSVRSGGPLVR
ncbi:MAG TPA: alpha/beta hydrolase [Actinomycetota bacterium]|nr:alpha/beta hydrolase [Actinomycetota bacterium]